MNIAKHINAIIQVFDHNGDGHLNVHDLRKQRELLDMSEEEVEEMIDIMAEISEVDQDGNIKCTGLYDHSGNLLLVLL